MGAGPKQHTSCDIAPNPEDPHDGRSDHGAKNPGHNDKDGGHVRHPPMTSETFMAMGVVMERGTRLVASELFKCIHFARNAEDIIASTDPVSTLSIISAACF